MFIILLIRLIRLSRLIWFIRLIRSLLRLRRLIILIRLIRLRLIDCCVVSRAVPTCDGRGLLRLADWFVVLLVELAVGFIKVKKWAL